MTNKLGQTVVTGDIEKPHHGKIRNWYREDHSDDPDVEGLGYIVIGRSDGHERFTGHTMHTSWVHKYDEETGEIETRNSRYTLVPARDDLPDDPS